MAERYTLVQAVNQALHDAMSKDSSTVVLGQDVGKCGGVFRATEGLQEKFGEQRVMDTPLAEAAIVGCSVGMAIKGLKPIAEMQFSGFSYQAFYQIEQHVARYHNRTRGLYPMSMVIRMPYGGGVRAFEHHSESRETYFVHTPGLKVVIPSTPSDAYDLLIASIADPNPVIFMEPKRIYRSMKSELDFSEAKLGEAKILQAGRQVTLIAYGAMIPLCQQAIERLPQYSIELIDLRTLSPWDEKTVVTSVQKTGRAVIVHEAPKTLGMASEIIASLNEKAFLYLQAPLKRVTGYDAIMPYYQRENEYLPNVDKIVSAIEETVEF
ncbi:MAG: alpha-ketoacid dehydrogenase subunit beta [Deltaproteobacteria bacterium]|nr:alpha-ketoacid dehydrogenase subunit beta [Deltaproteobacteria bacterium]